MTTISQILNRECQCVTLEKSVLEEVFHSKILKANGAEHLDIDALSKSYFSSSAYFLDPKELDAIQATVSTFQRILKNHTVRKELLREFPEPLRERYSEGGVFLSFDFHLTDSGPKLIEINTNAGGAFLQKKLVEAQQECCIEVRDALPSKEELNELEFSFLEIFLQEWKNSGKKDLSKFIAILDENPKEQFLYPEFILFKDLFLKQGIESEIVSPESLQADENGFLYHLGKKVDFIYNRLTDFYLDKPENRFLKNAWKEETVVISPNPLDYELYAKKANFILWNDSEFLKNAEVDSEDLRILSKAIPFTGFVKNVDPQTLWSERKKFFFKPTCGYGSKAVYRGDKLTKGVFQEIMDGDNIYQEIVNPSERILLKEGEKKIFKTDLRAYVYREKILLLASRLYQGQTTNFRTPGGGFSPVYVLPNL
ncbi:circularly permuted ATPgrasp domain protein [Leptospira barantonii]|uniref:Circularly permuted ATPgrasp domain protein n=1 Tax=Leptospira barantonii TaxID=2023184 RepID=A0ABX4NLY7_9LEPT|nr:circularly permuted ATPgrasp domain protein [Leptospira barantonii]PJZ57851.1 circularly permuted ATPgrasp domain protein [Leptospira barantonii]